MKKLIIGIAIALTVCGIATVSFESGTICGYLAAADSILGKGSAKKIVLGTIESLINKIETES